MGGRPPRHESAAPRARPPRSCSRCCCAATRELVPSALVAALFALHPLHVEVVAWVSQRKELLIDGVRAARRAVPTSRGRGAAARCAMRARCSRSRRRSPSKPMLVTLPFVLLLLDYWPLARSRSRRAGCVLEKLPLFALSAAACAVAFASQQLARATRARAVARAARSRTPPSPTSAISRSRSGPSGSRSSTRTRMRRSSAASRGRPRPWPRRVRRSSRSRRRRSRARAQPLPRGGLALVSRHARARDRSRPDRPAGPRRPLHLRAARSGLFIALAWGARDAIAARRLARPALRASAAARSRCSRSRRRRREPRARARVARLGEPLPRLARRDAAQSRAALQPGSDPGAAGPRRGRGAELRGGARDRSRTPGGERQPRKHPPARGRSPNEAIAHYRAALRRDPGRPPGAPEPRPRARVARRARRRRSRSSSAPRGSRPAMRACGATSNPCGRRSER